MRIALFQGLIDQVRQGRRADSGFKAEAYNAVVPKVQLVCPQQGVRIDKQECRSKISEYKALYSLWKTLSAKSGWGIDPETRLITTSDENWDTYLQVSIQISRKERDLPS
jgi:hypothetical protein